MSNLVVDAADTGFQAYDLKVAGIDGENGKDNRTVPAVDKRWMHL